MAAILTPGQIRERISSREAIERDRFEILRGLAYLLNVGDRPTCRDLTLRALEHRKAFGAMDEVLDTLLNEQGLFPYADVSHLSLTEALHYEFHRPLDYDEPEVVFHREQAEVYRYLMDGQSVILSAPTSFGKSKVIDAVIASGKFNNIVVVVPTIALIDETRKRLSRFGNRYKIVTQTSQAPGERNIFLFTAERTIAYRDLPNIDFFVIDEFYKIGALKEDPSRTAALNQAFIRLLKYGASFYMLGPNIRQIPSGLKDRFKCHFISTEFQTVVSEVTRVRPGADDMQTLVQLCKVVDGATLVYCQSPKRVNEVARALVDSGSEVVSLEMSEATKWIAENYHPEWILPQALVKGIGLHHGRLPRSLSQFIVRAFNDGLLKTLVCTSTLIEGVNTKAKNVVIFDNKIATSKFDYFTFNNIKGRSGRMFQHFVGRVFLFHEPPAQELPFVDFPMFTQEDGTPDSILMELDEKDLKPNSKERLQAIMNQTDLSVETIRRHSGVEPELLIALARRLRGLSQLDRRLLGWSGHPTSEQLRKTCGILWDELTSRRRHGGVGSAAQLFFKVSQLRATNGVKARIAHELNQTGQYKPKSADEAVERVLEFDRSWASFELPKLLRAFSDIRREVIGGYGDYTYFINELENLFQGEYHSALEEFGLPAQVTDKLMPRLDGPESLDDVLVRLKALDPNSSGLSGFELQLFNEFRETL
jgi:hypothetical protein